MRKFKLRLISGINTDLDRATSDIERWFGTRNCIINKPNEITIDAYLEENDRDFLTEVTIDCRVANIEIIETVIQ